MNQNNPESKAQILYFSHGGGPLPLLGDPGHQAMVEFVSGLPARLRKPDLILVISAHWEEPLATLMSAPKPPMFYDYYGFPKQAYQISYPAPGSPPAAEKIAAILEQEQIPARLDPQRGFDHGLFIPLMMMYPQADIACLQLSLLSSLDPAQHLALGKALRRLNHENILVIGSGFSFHNMRAFSWGGQAAPDPANDAFQDWLIETCTAPYTQAEREQRLAGWEKAPSARYCHPREEHLLPLHICQGMAGEPAQTIFDEAILGKRAVAFLW
jgi:aromatic ring-opening dioxygenase catalytic subunit (LigB family)